MVGRNLIAKLKGSLLLSGCDDHEYSYDAYIDGRYNGAFTRTALDVLTQTVPANVTPKPLSYDRWHDIISHRLPNDYYPQSPQLYGSAYRRRGRVFD